MNEYLCKLVDRWVIRSAASRMPRATGANPHVEEARRLLESPDFFAENTPPLTLTFTGGKNFQFASPVVTASPENNLVRGRISRCGKNWRKRPVVVMLHGWKDRIGYKYRFPWLSRRFNRRGINSVTFELPYHFQRRPDRGDVREFFTEDLGRSMETVHQALAEINGMVNWLLEQGCPRVSLLGFSLGGWLAGLVASHNPGVACAALVTPVSRVDRMIEEVSFCSTIRRALQNNPLDLTRLNLVSQKSRLTRGFILLVEADYDQFVPSDTTHELWQAWSSPELWSMPHGHITVLASTDMLKRASKWLGLRMKLPDTVNEGIRPDQVLG